MEANKIIILGDFSNHMDKDLYRDYLQHVADILKWEREMILDIKLSARVYEAPRDIPVSA